MKPLRELIEHSIAPASLACLGKRDARLDQILLERLRPQSELFGAQVCALRDTDVIAHDAADHEAYGCTDRPADERTGRGTCQTAHALLLREPVLLVRIRGTARQR